MSRSVIRFVLFLGAALVTCTVLLLLRGEPTASEWIGAGFLVLAEALIALFPAAAARYDFPLRTPLLLLVFPGYLVVTLLLALLAGGLVWRKLLVLELVAAFFVFAAMCITALAGKAREENR